VETESALLDLISGGYFQSFLHLKEAVAAVSRSEGFAIAQSTHTLDAKSSKHIFASDKQLVQRGFFYCNFKESERKSAKTVKTTCTWSVPFTLNFDRKEWMLKTVCLVPNHQIADPNIVAGGLTLIKLDGQLLESEIDFIRNHSQFSLPLSKVVFHQPVCSAI
jgi:hypothetical protein